MRRNAPLIIRVVFTAAIVIPVTIALASTGLALADVLRLDATACRIGFTLGATLHQVKGAFRLQSGTIIFDPATGEASGRVVIATGSGETHNDKRDRKMHEKVLESGLFPEIVFIPARFEGTFLPAGDSEVRIKGALEIHGARHDIVIPARVHVENGRLTGNAGLTVPYVAWGMTDPSFLMLRVAKEVVVSLDLAGTVEEVTDGSPAPAGHVADRPAP